MNSEHVHIIKSFKHNGKLHRMWLENWLVPARLLHPEQAASGTLVLVNNQTKIQEADGKEWTSRIPSVAFFLPNQWFNVIALLEEGGVRYYCNIASPPYLNKRVLTYIDYDLDVIVNPRGEVQIVDQEEYDAHKLNYHYSDIVDQKVRAGLESLLDLIRQRGSPFREETVMEYFELWRNREAGV
ncbi:DUF402 domain-containing protein [Paenibacillus sp. y28]|uniref:DUF402 domain-containing protein n=1 Tax=Paenibacillus sp. y28 TaxID=3129110 RepID=UPI003015C9B6